MTKTFNVKITLSDTQYEALQAVYRLQTNSLDDYCSQAVQTILRMDVDAYVVCNAPRKQELEALSQ
jgi:hypothetical protein